MDCGEASLVQLLRVHGQHGGDAEGENLILKRYYSQIRKKIQIQTIIIDNKYYCILASAT